MLEHWGHPGVVVADVDCTAGGKELCNRFSIPSYPTIKFGDPDFLEDYEGERSLQALRQLFSEVSSGRCGAANTSACGPAQTALLDRFLTMEEDELDRLVAARREELDNITAESTHSLKGLQGQYHKAVAEGRAQQEKLRSAGLRLMKASLARRTRTPRCSPARLDSCDDATRSALERYMAMPDDQLNGEVETREEELRSLEVELPPLLEKLKGQYQEAERKAKADKERIKDSGLRVMRAVLARRQRAAQRVGA